MQVGGIRLMILSCPHVWVWKVVCLAAIDWWPGCLWPYGSWNWLLPPATLMYRWTDDSCVLNPLNWRKKRRTWQFYVNQNLTLLITPKNNSLNSFYLSAWLSMHRDSLNEVRIIMGRISILINFFLLSTFIGLTQFARAGSTQLNSVGLNCSKQVHSSWVNEVGS